MRKNGEYYRDIVLYCSHDRTDCTLLELYCT